MAHKCALIVDDSRTARQVLGEMLCAHQLRVETASSAEEALEFLAHSRPDVIFMDHMMPGMDGLQAVRAIKNNPATATIPIMMYTSQEGEVYVGQARALGAVGVLPKQIKPVQVTEALKSLRLVEGDPPPPPPPVERRRESQRDMAQALNVRDWTDMHQWLGEMFAHHASEMRSDVEATVTRVLREHASEQPALSEPPPVRRPLLAPALLVALTALAGVFFWLHLDTQRKWRDAVEQNAGLMAAMDSQRAAAAATATSTVRQLDAERDEVSGRFAEFLRSVEWSVNQSASYPAAAEPFGARRLEILRGLLERLQALGFTGTVRLDAHVGDFCLVRNEDETYSIAPESLPAGECARIGWPADEARARSARQSVAFANFLATRAADPAVRIEVLAHGSAAPRSPYPPDPQGLTAGEWNAIAQENHRVDITLIPDALLP